MAGGIVIRDMRDADVEHVVAVWHASGVARPRNDPPRDIAFARRDTGTTCFQKIIEPTQS